VPANRRETFEKRQRDKARRDKAAAKRAKKVERAENGDPEAGDETATEVTSGPSDEQTLAALAALHASYDAEEISFDDFEERRSELLARLTIT
jgi:hypothetical protein